MNVTVCKFGPLYIVVCASFKTPHHQILVDHIWLNVEFIFCLTTTV